MITGGAVPARLYRVYRVTSRPRRTQKRDEAGDLALLMGQGGNALLIGFDDLQLEYEVHVISPPLLSAVVCRGCSGQSGGWCRRVIGVQERQEGTRSVEDRLQGHEHSRRSGGQVHGQP
jgi:hypothetical protein